MTERVPDFLVERLARGELSVDEAARVRGLLGDQADARVREIAADDAATLARLPAADVAATVRRRQGAQAQPSRGARWWIPTTALAAASLAVWCVVRPGPHSGGGELPIDGGDDGLSLGDPTAADVVRIKGDATLTIDRLAGSGPQRLQDGARVRTGDRLQLQYRAGDREQGAIVSVDGRGGATLHFPADVHDSPRLRSGGLIALDHSYELDDAPGFERFFFVTVASGAAFEVEAVLRAAQQLAAGADAERGALVLPPGHASVSVRLDK